MAKQDVGAVGNYEKEKSQASDSFKRACFNWGIGRELYSAPFLWIPAGSVEIQKKGDLYFCKERFSVSRIAYNEEREIAALVIVNSRGETVYEFGQQNVSPERDFGNSNLSKEQLASLAAELKRTGVELEAVRDRYQIREPEQMSPELYERVMKALRRTKSVQAA